MRVDTKFNYFFFFFLLFAVIIGFFINKCFSNKMIEKVANTRKNLKSISLKVEQYYKTYCTLPSSITEKQFYIFLNGINTVDPFESTHSKFRYTVESGKWKIYSVGPNKVDNGGVAHKHNSSELLDIVIEGDLKKLRNDCKNMNTSSSGKK